MVKTTTNLLKMIPEYKEIRVYCDCLGQSVWVSSGQITEILENKPPALFHNVETVSDKLLIIGRT